MSKFKEKMLQDMKLRNFSPNTQNSYIMHINHFEEFFDSNAGVDLVYIQQLMGHASIKTTSKYLRLRDKRVLKIKSPLDTLSYDKNA